MKKALKSSLMLLLVLSLVMLAACTNSDSENAKPADDAKDEGKTEGTTVATADGEKVEIEF